MKIAPIVEEMSRHPQIEQLLLHTGQHYDDNMSKVFFDDLDLPQPDICLGVGSGTHAQQTARIMMAFEQVVSTKKPDLVLVVGDVNSTLACAITVAKLHVPLAHVEAGLRSFDRRMPEEINRLVTDALSDYLFTTCKEANHNLSREGIAANKVFFVGNVMIDALLKHRERALRLDVLGKYGLKAREYALLTLHRPSNVDHSETLRGILEALAVVQERVRILFPAHPRAAKRLRELKLLDKVSSLPSFIMTKPLGYLEFLNLMMNARFVLTDSGGIQEETTFLGIPCLTLRDTTERPVTVNEGTNKVIGSHKESIVLESLRILDGEEKRGQVPELWDGHAAERIVRVLLDA
jgi:UDP-N-acetylglucosamine 2-epimerase (non-hydrolysing)